MTDPAPNRNELPPVQVFGQPELEEYLEASGAHHTHLISIGNPRRPFGINRRDTQMPPAFRRSFETVLRLTFYDVEHKRHLRCRDFPKRVPRRSDVRRAVRFFHRTRGWASGYTIHCWQGLSRSTAIALGYLYLLTGSEEAAKQALFQIRPQARPNQRLVELFDEELGSNLSAISAEIGNEHLRRMKEELDLNQDSLLEELPGVEE